MKWEAGLISLVAAASDAIAAWTQPALTRTAVLREGL